MATTKIVRVRTPGGVEQFEVANVELPVPAADEVRIRQSAIGVNFADIYQRSGLYPMPPANIPGVEGVGVVAAVGADVNGLSVGDRIAYAGAPVGAYAVERNLPASRVIKLPDAISDEAAISVFVKGITAHMLLTSLSGYARHDAIGSQRCRRARAVVDALGQPSRRDGDWRRRLPGQGRDRARGWCCARHRRPRRRFCQGGVGIDGQSRCRCRL